MRELDFLELINKQLDDNSLLGDDCAYLKDLGIYITQDTLVENIHFTLYTTTPYLLGRKSVSVNLSDLAAALAKPLYITVSLSLPSLIEDDFVSEFYRGVNDVCSEYNVKVAGGDLTGSDKIIVSVCAIGRKISQFSTSRKNAQKGDFVVVTGVHGSSSAGFYALSQFLQADSELINAHINPIPKINEAIQLADLLERDISVMDSSDGFVDAVYKISQASKHSIEVDINSLPVSEKLIEFSKQNNKDYKQFAKWGGEDFELVICMPEELYLKLDKSQYNIVGKVVNKDLNPCVIIKDGEKREKITKELFRKESFNHFK